jgi:hypothetical protein
MRLEPKTDADPHCGPAKNNKVEIHESYNAPAASYTSI